ncbi:MAG: class I SAM-dependent methyltransferase [Proteobacteria bacterium]|uniref:Class I SAM-dependent methyltransferase n=1 Tax=Candidatus Avisuccinivibrio stercorigallinarum TaxID=2840704 RepID=A0A9D9GU88_9GAMM|nr:class I SAM-dependent methyltransferase [Candidatus Avisuccinivibrio stercorigallinarum]
MLPTITLAPGREKSVLRRHPWIFSKAVAKEDNSIPPGSVVKVNAADCSFLALGIYSPKSQIRVRLLSFNEQDNIDAAFVQQRIENACELRQRLIARGNDGVRLVASEGDYLPGLIVDKYNEFLVIAISSWAAESLREHIIQALKKLYPDCSIYERSDSKSRLKEGLKARCGVIAGKEPDDIIYVKENGLIYLPIDIKNGHKTGGYLDQRQSRYKAYTLSKGARVLNCFSYTGGFGLWALKGGAARVENVDVSELALTHAKDGVVFNHLDPGRCRFLKKDVFAYLRQQTAKGEKYDLVILDPPKFAESAANLKQACRGYQDINRLGLSLVAKGGRLLTFSCSGLMEPTLFQKICADAALDAGVEAQVISTLRQDEDHVVSLPCPESFYLKGLVIAVR